MTESLIQFLFIFILTWIQAVPSVANRTYTWVPNVNNLVPVDDTSNAAGSSIALSNNGILVLGGSGDSSNLGAIWAYTRGYKSWIPLGGKITGTDSTGSTVKQGSSVAISDKGEIIASGAPEDDSTVGAVFVFAWDGTMYSQQGPKLAATTPAGAQGQGWSVALNGAGDVLASGAVYVHSSQGGVYIFTRSGTTWTRYSQLLVGTSMTGASKLGFSVSLSNAGDILAAGGPYDDSNKGGVWIFGLANGVWALQTSDKLLGTPITSSSSLQGYSVSLNGIGTMVAVGAPEEGAGQGGAVWTFILDDTFGWVQESKISTGFQSTTERGGSVALNYAGDLLALGGNVADGQVDIFSMNSSGIFLQTVLQYPGPGHCLALSRNGSMLVVGEDGSAGYQGAFTLVENDYVPYFPTNFIRQGTSVFVDDDPDGVTVSLSADGLTLAVGSYNENGGDGMVYVNYYNEGTIPAWQLGNRWDSGTSMLATDNIGAAQQGYSIVISDSGDRIAAGGNTDDSDLGAVWIWHRNGAAWVQEAKLIGTTGSGNPQKQGSDVAMSSNGDTVASCAPTGGGNAGAGQGGVYIFKRTDTAWNPQDSMFGTVQWTAVSLSNSGDILAVGGPSDSGNLGAVWIFFRTNDVWSTGPTLTPTMDSIAGSKHFGISLSLSGNGQTLAIGGDIDDQNEGATWIFSSSDSLNWKQDVKLVGTGRMTPAQQGTNVALSDAGDRLAVGGPSDIHGSVWIFSKDSNGFWIQNGTQLTPFDGTQFGLGGVTWSSTAERLVVGDTHAFYSYDKNRIPCLQLSPPDNGVWESVSEGVLPGSIRKLSCNSGYIPSGNVVFTCLGPRWNPSQVGLCVRAPFGFPELNQPIHIRSFFNKLNYYLDRSSQTSTCIPNGDNIPNLNANANRDRTNSLVSGRWIFKPFDTLPTNVQWTNCLRYGTPYYIINQQSGAYLTLCGASSCTSGASSIQLSKVSQGQNSVWNLTYPDKITGDCVLFTDHVHIRTQKTSKSVEICQSSATEYRLEGLVTQAMGEWEILPVLPEHYIEMQSSNGIPMDLMASGTITTQNVMPDPNSKALQIQTNGFIIYTTILAQFHQEPFFINFWIFITDASSQDVPLLSNKETSTNNYFAIYQTSTNQILVSWSGDGTGVIITNSMISTQSINLNQWNHIMFRRNEIINFKSDHSVWVNGKMSNLNVETSNINGNTPFRSGMEKDSSVEWNGIISDIVFIQRLVTDEEVNQFPQTTSDVCKDSYYMPTTKVACKYALPPDGHHYMLNRGDLVDINNPNEPSYRLTKSGDIVNYDFTRAAYFARNLVNPNYMTFDSADPFSFGGTDFAISFWLQLDFQNPIPTTDGYFSLLSNRNSLSTGPYLDLRMTQDCYLKVIICDDLSVSYVLYPEQRLDDGLWRNVIIRKVDDQFELWFDGVKADSVTLTSFNTLSSTVPVKMNLDPLGTSTPWEGSMAGLLIYPRKLTDSELIQIAQSTQEVCMNGWFLDIERMRCIPPQCTSDTAHSCYQGPYSYDYATYWGCNNHLADGAWCPFDNVDGDDNYVGQASDYCLHCNIPQPKLAVGLLSVKTSSIMPPLEDSIDCNPTLCDPLNRLPCARHLPNQQVCGNCKTYQYISESGVLNDAPSVLQCNLKAQGAPILANGISALFEANVENCSPALVEDAGWAAIDQLSDAFTFPKQRIRVIALDCRDVPVIETTPPPFTETTPSPSPAPLQGNSLNSLPKHLLEMDYEKRLNYQRQQLMSPGQKSTTKRAEITLLISPSLNPEDPTPLELAHVINTAILDFPNSRYEGYLGGNLYNPKYNLTFATCPVQNFIGSAVQVEQQLCYTGKWDYPSLCPTSDGVQSSVEWLPAQVSNFKFGQQITFQVKLKDSTVSGNSIEISNAENQSTPVHSGEHLLVQTNTKKHLQTTNPFKGWLQFLTGLGVPIGGSVYPDATGLATLTLIDLPVDAKFTSFMAQFMGDERFASSFTPALRELDIQKGSTSTTLSMYPPPTSNINQNTVLTFYIRVEATYSTYIIPTGNIKFRRKTNQLIKNLVLYPVLGQIAYQTTLPVGTYSLVADYNGSAGFVGSISKELNFTVKKAVFKTNSGNAQYLGGQIVANPNIVMVLWGKGVYLKEISTKKKSAFNKRNMQQFYTALVSNNPYLQAVEEYSTKGVKPVSGVKSSDQVIGPGKFVGRFQIMPKIKKKPYPKNITDDIIQKELIKAIKNGKVPKPIYDNGAQTMVYLIHLPKGQVARTATDETCAWGRSDVVGTCGYHGVITYETKPISYAVLPDLSTGSGCEYVCGSSSDPFLMQTSVSSHEVLEAMTSVWENSNWNPGPEINDRCEADAPFYGANGQLMLVQRFYSNSRTNCVSAISSNFNISAVFSGLSGDLGSPITFEFRTNKYGSVQGSPNIAAPTSIKIVATGTPPQWTPTWSRTQPFPAGQSIKYTVTPSVALNTIRLQKITIQATDSGSGTSTYIPIVVAVNNILNGDFEKGNQAAIPTNWQIVGKARQITGFVISGVASAWLGYPDTGINSISQRFRVNAGELSFYYFALCGQKLSNIDYKTVVTTSTIKIGSVTKQVLNATCSGGLTNWNKVTVDVSSYRNQFLTLTLQVNVGTSFGVTYFDKVVLKEKNEKDA